MNKLDEIIKEQNIIGVMRQPPHGIDFAKRVAIEFAKHILEEAADKAKMLQDFGEDFNGKFVIKKLKSYNDEDGNPIYIDKQSITDTIKKYL